MESLLQTQTPLLVTLSLIFIVGAVAFFGWKRAISAQLRAASATHLQEKIDQLEAEAEELEALHLAAEKKASALEAQLGAVKEQQAQSEKLMEQFKQAAQASVLKAGQELSSKLLEDHKREAKVQRETQEQFTHKTTQQLLEQVTKLGQQFATTDQRSSDNAKQMETVMRALTHPGGAGALAEVGLENSLKKLGLEPGRDFMTQFHIAREEGALRPDAVIFLPQDRVMVVDSKASKHLLELAEAEGTEREDAVLKQLLQRMQQHMTGLSRKDYRKAVADALKEEQRSFSEMLNVMYLPSDAMIERLRKADKSLMEQAEKLDIILAGPTSMIGLFSIAKQQIGQARQQENQQKIMLLVQELMDSFATALTHVDGIGKGLQSSAKKFDDFAASLNARLLPRLRKLEHFGVSGSSNKALPQSLPRYEVMRRDEIVMLEADEEQSPRLVEKKEA
jgi:DNA recombination protein RmuC